MNTLRAVVVNVVMNFAVLRPLYLLLGRDDTAALSTSQHTGEVEDVAFRAGLALPTEQYLNAVKLLVGYHLLVSTLIPRATTSWILKHAVVEGIRENVVD
ncbi:MAG: hypothetical protein WCG07_00795 [Candidatus Taylorbacteria bacterium]